MALDAVLGALGGIVDLYNLTKRTKDKVLMARVKILYRRMKKIERKLERGKMTKADFDKEVEGCLK